MGLSAYEQDDLVKASELDTAETVDIHLKPEPTHAKRGIKHEPADQVKPALKRDKIEASPRPSSAIKKADPYLSEEAGPIRKGKVLKNRS